VSKLTGAGGGGCALTLLRNNTPQSKISDASRALTTDGFDCFQTQMGVAGVFFFTPKPAKSGVLSITYSWLWTLGSVATAVVLGALVAKKYGVFGRRY